ncbi:MAG: XRE family transcriptional regulator [Oscillospiraceae bacterium]|nr:XRE family transcriptional regulator [Oscillospiraceae bacterium]
MRLRTKHIGERNIIGTYVSKRRRQIGLKQKDLLTQLQIMGIDLNASGLSKIEGQIRYVADFELKALSEALGCSISDMFEEDAYFDDEE